MCLQNTHGSNSFRNTDYFDEGSSWILSVLGNRGCTTAEAVCRWPPNTEKPRINHGPVSVRSVVENVAVRRDFIRVQLKLQYPAVKGTECYIKRKLTFRFQHFHQPTAVLWIWWLQERNVEVMLALFWTLYTQCYSSCVADVTASA